MSKTIAVCGATGGMGGAVVQRLLKSPEWKVRGVTRDTNSDKAKALEDQGVEMVSASYDDVDSMQKAFAVRRTSLCPIVLRLTRHLGCNSDFCDHQLLASHRDFR